MSSIRSSGNQSSVRAFVWFALFACLLVVFALGAKGVFVRLPGQPPLPMLFGATVPLVIFAAAYLASRQFKLLVRTADLRLGAAIQAWRVGGLGFLALYVHGVLPRQFALPAGLGDIAIGLTAPWVVLALINRPGFASSRLFVVWNLLGILDLIVAIGMGGLSSGFMPGWTDKVTTTPMTQLPLVLIPAYFVPLFVMLHISALVQARRTDSGETAAN